MEQTKNEPKNENKAAPDNGKPKKERKPLTEAQRLKRQKMIVLPAMVLVFIGAMWLIFAPSSDKEQQPGTGGYNIEMPDADKANRQIIGDKVKAYEQGAMEERQENRSRTMQELGYMFDREVAETDSGRDFDLANPRGMEENVKSARRPSNHPQRLPRPQCHARQLLRAAKERQCGYGRTVRAYRLAGIGTGNRERQGIRYG